MNNIKKYTKKSLKKKEAIYTGNSVTNLRIGIESCEKKLLDLNLILLNYKANENNIKARILSNIETVDQAGLQTHSNPVQSFSMSNADPNPNRAIPIAEFNAMHKSYGTRDLFSLLNTIDHEIKSVMTDIKQTEADLNIFKAQLADAEAKFKNPVGFLKGILPPTASDLEKDTIQKSRLSNLSLLYQLSLSFHSLTVNNKGERKYSDDPAMPEILMKLKNTFWAHAQQFPEYIEGDKKLDFMDPGSEWNIIILQKDHGVLKVAGISEKADSATAEYVKTITSVSNNSMHSKNLSTKEDTPLLPDESLAYKTRYFSATATRMGVSFNGSFELPDLLSSIKKWWKNKNKDLVVGLPLCPNAPKPIQTSTNTSPIRRAQETADIVAKEKGKYEFQIALANAMTAKEKVDISSEIPSGAPPWVKIFNSTYGDASIGNIQFNNGSYFVTQTVSDTIDSAKKDTEDIVGQGSLLKSVAQYAYSPVLNEALASTIKAGTQTFVYFTLWESLPEEPETVETPPAPALTPNQKRSKEIDEAIVKIDKEINALGGNIPTRDTNNYFDPEQVSRVNTKINDKALQALYDQKNVLLEEQRALFSSETRNKGEVNLNT